MKTGYRGTFVIAWSQTEVDGLRAAPAAMVTTGATWRWTGEATRVDGPQSLMLLSGDPNGDALRRRASRMVRRLVGVALGDAGDPIGMDEDEDEMNEAEHGFVLTDGRRTFDATVVDTPGQGVPLITFVGEVPPADRDLWVVRSTLPAVPERVSDETRAGVICFTPGTRIATPRGPRPIELLRPGERILTKDNGPQEVVWHGQRKLTGARLYAMPHLRPIRFRAGALGIARPDADLLVSPQHRMLVQGAAARTLFNTDEVLVAAEDLVNERTIAVDIRLREVTYVHIMLESHQIVWANGLETESFHPSATSLEMIDPDQRARLFEVAPELAGNPQVYGAYARRNLSASEAAILKYDAA